VHPPVAPPVAPDVVPDVPAREDVPAGPVGCGAAGVVASAFDRVDLELRRVRGLDLRDAGSDALEQALSRVARVERGLAELRGRIIAAAESGGAVSGSGAADTTAWVRRAAGVSGRVARRQTELGRALTAAPALGDALAAGALDVEVAEAVGAAVRRGRLGPAADVTDTLLEVATSGRTPEQVRAEIRRREAAAEPGRLLADEQAAHRRRSVRRWWRDDGMLEGTFLLDHLTGALVDEVLGACDRPDAAGTPIRERRTTEQRTADAFASAFGLAAGSARTSRSSCPSRRSSSAPPAPAPAAPAASTPTGPACDWPRPPWDRSRTPLSTGCCATAR
jgi:hypothetical protein